MLAFLSDAGAAAPLNAGHLGFIRRAVALVNEKFKSQVGAAAVSVAALPPSTDAGALRAFVSELRREEVKVHIDLDTCIGVGCFVCIFRCSAVVFAGFLRRSRWQGSRRAIFHRRQPQIS